MKPIKPLGRFNKLSSAQSFSEKTEKQAPIVIGTDNKFWVVTMADFTKAMVLNWTAVK